MKKTGSAKITQALLWLIGLDLALLILSRAGFVSLPSGLAFPLILVLLIAPSLAWWGWIRGNLGQRVPRWARLILAAYAMGMVAPLLVATLGRQRFWDAMPVGFITWLMVWYVTVLAVTCVILGGSTISILKRLATAIKRASATDPPPGTNNSGEGPTQPRSAGITRRAMLGWATAAGSLALAGGGVGVGFSQSGRFEVRRVRMALARCPERLKGLTITHLSDLHVGRLFRPEYLPGVVEAANRLDSDLVVVTGDIVDHSIDFLPAAADAIGQLEGRHGRFVVMGNHDLIDSGQAFVAEMARREPGFLCDEHRIIEVDGERIQIAGLRWASRDRGEGVFVGHEERASAALTGADANCFTIGLAHHPHAFDALARRGVDLTLSGHTHGGQFNAPIPGSRLVISAAMLMFRYIHGEYRNGSAALFVNAGVGNWFPVRINAPAEIVQIQLT